MEETRFEPKMMKNMNFQVSAISWDRERTSFSSRNSTKTILVNNLDKLFITKTDITIIVHFHLLQHRRYKENL